MSGWANSVTERGGTIAASHPSLSSVEDEQADELGNHSICVYIIIELGSVLPTTERYPTKQKYTTNIVTVEGVEE